jgi:hypothetical protein
VSQRRGAAPSPHSSSSGDNASSYHFGLTIAVSAVGGVVLIIVITWIVSYIRKRRRCTVIWTADGTNPGEFTEMEPAHDSEDL